MTNVILGILGIVLAAAAALITIDYGGDYYVDAAQQGNAAVVMHAAQNVQTAFDLHVMRNNSEPSSVTDLLSTNSPVKRGFLASVPALGGNGNFNMNWASGWPRKVFWVSNVPRDVCGAINKRANYVTNHTVIPTAFGAGWREGCYNPTAGQPQSDNFYVRYMTT